MLLDGAFVIFHHCLKRKERTQKLGFSLYFCLEGSVAD